MKTSFSQRMKGRRQSSNVEDFRKGQPLGSYAKAAWAPVGEVIGLFPSPQGIGPRKPKAIPLSGTAKMVSGMSNPATKPKKLGLRGTK